MSSGSLDQILFYHGVSTRTPLSRATEEQLIKSLISVASDLIYLHDDCQHPLIIHEGIKWRDIMLDAEMNACLGDFGLTRSVEEGSSHYTSKVILVSCLMCIPWFLLLTNTTDTDLMYVSKTRWLFGEFSCLTRWFLAQPATLRRASKKPDVYAFGPTMLSSG